jgi:hypothetical protein
VGCHPRLFTWKPFGFQAAAGQLASRWDAPEQKANVPVELTREEVAKVVPRVEGVWGGCAVACRGRYGRGSAPRFVAGEGVSFVPARTQDGRGRTSPTSGLQRGSICFSLSRIYAIAGGPHAARVSSSPAGRRPPGPNNQVTER